MTIFEAKTALNKFLEEHPELKPMQVMIDAVLSGAASNHNRNVLIQKMMVDKSQELAKELYKAADLVKKAGL